MRAELDVLPDRLPERRVGGQPGLVKRLQVRRDKTLALLIGDLQAKPLPGTRRQSFTESQTGRAPALLYARERNPPRQEERGSS